MARERKRMALRQAKAQRGERRDWKAKIQIEGWVGDVEKSGGNDGCCAVEIKRATPRKPEAQKNYPRPWASAAIAWTSTSPIRYKHNLKIRLKWYSRLWNGRWYRISRITWPRLSPNCTSISQRAPYNLIFHKELRQMRCTRMMRCLLRIAKTIWTQRPATTWTRRSSTPRKRRS